jgi:cell wall-associated NlpC family hydrolase
MSIKCLRTTSLTIALAAAALVSSARPALAGSDDDGDGEISAGSDDVLDTARALTDEYRADGVRYHAVRPLGENEADCNSFVHDVEQSAGNDVGQVSTRALPTSPEYTSVDPEDAEPGDVILTPSPDGGRSGHMGIYSGDDDAGRSWGYQMGEHGAAEVPWKGNPQYYRPSTTEDLEGRIRDQLEELSPPSPPARPSGSSGSSCSGCAIPAL